MSSLALEIRQLQKCRDVKKPVLKSEIVTFNSKSFKEIFQNTSLTWLSNLKKFYF